MSDKGTVKGLTHVITGTSRKKRLFQCFAIYFLGNSTPIAKTPITSTTRQNSRVIALLTSVSPFPQDCGSKILAQKGPEQNQLLGGKKQQDLVDLPIITPKRNANSASPIYNYSKRKF
jgi:hypothetical protein